jgi:phosphoribosylformylglycinamidine synthase II
MGKFRIEISSKIKDALSESFENKIRKLGYDVSVNAVQIYTIDNDFSKEEIKKIAYSLHNEVVHEVKINEPTSAEFDYALELGFLPGVTDNVSHTVTEIINDLFKTDIGLNKVFTSHLLYLKGNLKPEDIENITKNLINTLIQRHHFKSYEQYKKDDGMDFIIPTVNLEKTDKVMDVDLDVEDSELLTIGKNGVLDPKTNTRRGPLALDLDYMNAIKDYFETEKRNPTDIELESLAQTWSEHCKHTYFAGRIDEIENGIYSEYIKKATNEIREELGEKDFCISVFKDNSGSIIFDENHMISDKVETHNSPSALDPFGGAITGIVGVNRDCVGFGMGAKPIANRYGFCVGNPEDQTMVYRGKNKKNPALLPKKILEGVIDGVNKGGNCSGIPTPQGFVNFDDSYKGKPLIFVGTVGIMPLKENGKLLHEKKAENNDHIVVIGGRVGKDGIHGATFSSTALDEGSPATAVQIGDPITQKKLSDAIVKEARQLELYSSITDNGAGGISCSVSEMAKESGGFVVNLEEVPLKYPGLQPWETWISESQERMTLSIPDKNLKPFMELMKNRGVEAKTIGRFNDGDRAVVKYDDQTIMDVDMDFLHEGLPKRNFESKPYKYNTTEPEIKITDQQTFFEKMLSRNNIASFEFISRQYDHEVQNNSVVKPLQGKNSVNGSSSVIKPLPTSDKGVVLSQGFNPRLSLVNSYDMAANAIDEAIRNAVAVGGNVNHLALLDNFCWCSSDEPERIEQLKDAARACYDYAKIFKTPYISGKDSMFNDFKGYDENNNPIKISVLPTLLISSIGVIPDASKTNTIDFKMADDLIYVIGETKDECAGSELYNVFNEVGNKAPKVDAKKSRLLYEKIFEITQKDLLSACAPLGKGGIAVTLAKMSISGDLGAKVDIAKSPNNNVEISKLLYSETPSRFMVSIDPKNKQEFESSMTGFEIGEIGKVTKKELVISKEDDTIISAEISNLTTTYKEKFKDY